MGKLTFITGNSDKAKQIQEFLNIEIDHQKVDLDEIQSLNLKIIAEHKVRQAYEKLKRPVFVEDVSLVFNALGKLPGPLIKWFLESIGNEGMCKLLDGYDDRTAVAEVVFGYYDGENLEFFDAEILGRIINTPRGSAGFGFDHIFVPDGQEKTWAEIDILKHPEFSMRIPALRKLEKYLEEKQK
ncbi:MAG: non-canonical purine NTP pyrophosphatase [Patescibacteria group bacterium]|jgi:non-canonical purine NTP pyrophosphatase (RdgB/HAM1 family)